jgi:APA family basic amino acid/polyamine antiporter/cationic amino acid transporter 4
MSAITIVYCTMSIDANAAYSVAFTAAGMKWARVS